MLFLYRFFSGVLLVEFFGVYPEKLLNLCAKNGINIWSARFVKQKIRCFITVKDFLKLPKILRKSGIRVHILEKKGFPFFIKKYKKRSGFFVGIVLFFTFLQVMSAHIWVIDVEGVKKVPESEILTICEDLGIKPGILKKTINAKNSAQKLLLKSGKLAWASFNIEGSCLTVNVTEITEKAEDNSVPTNLKASADGVITHIDVTSGNCVVKVGDVVKKGDLLVSGIIENANGTRFVHSIGEIIAVTESEVVLEEKFLNKVTYPTGRIKEKSVIDFFTLKIPLYIGSESGKYTTEISAKTASLFSQRLPIKVYTKRFVFQRTETVRLSYEDAVENLEKKLKAEYKGQVKQKEFFENDEGVILRAVIEDKTDITQSEELIVDRENGSD